MLGNWDTSPRIGKQNVPPANAPSKLTGTTAASSAAAGTVCSVCTRRFTTALSPENLALHLKSKACQAKAKPSSQAGHAGPEPSIPLAKPCVEPATARADEFQEPSQVAEEKARKQRERKKAETDRKRKRDEEKRETKRREAETERADLEVSRQANLVALHQAAEQNAELLNEICKLDKECRDAACSKLHHCTNFSTGSHAWVCRRLLRGALSRATRIGHSPRQLLCDKCSEISRACLKK